MYRVTVLYKNRDGGTFDHDYYRDKHLPMVMGFLGDVGVRSESTKGLPGGDGAAPAFAATGTIWVTDIARFGEVLGEKAAEILGDISNYTDLEPQILFEEVVA